MPRRKVKKTTKKDDDNFDSAAIVLSEAGEVAIVSLLASVEARSLIDDSSELNGVDNIVIDDISSDSSEDDNDSDEDEVTENTCTQGL